MTIHETRTRLTPDEVMERAKSFFALASTPYAATVEQRSAGFLKLHLEVGEIVLGALPQSDATLVRGSASRGGHLLTRFLTTLAPPLDAVQATHRYDYHVTRAAQVEVLAEPVPTAPPPGARPTARAA